MANRFTRSFYQIKDYLSPIKYQREEPQTNIRTSAIPQEYRNAVSQAYKLYPQIPTGLIESVAQMESDFGSNKTNQPYDLGKFGYVTGLTKTGYAANVISSLAKNPTLDYKVKNVPGWQDVSTPEAAFGYTASALATAIRDNPGMSLEDIYFKKYNANTKVDTPERRERFRKELEKYGLTEKLNQKAKGFEAESQKGLGSRFVEELPSATKKVFQNIGGLVENVLPGLKAVRESIQQKSIEPYKTFAKQTQEKFKMENLLANKGKGLQDVVLGIVGGASGDISETLTKIAKEKSPQVIKNILKDNFKNFTDDVIDSISPKLSKVSTPEEVTGILKEGLQKLVKPEIFGKSSEFPNIISGEARTLETEAQKSLTESNVGNIAKPLTKIVTETTPVAKKVGVLDYLRTPEKVMEKIGLKKESDFLRQKYNDYILELPKNIQKITEWSKEVPKESNERIFRYLDGEAIDLTKPEAKVTSEIKTWLEEWANRLGLPKDNRISDYITHIFPKEKSGEFDEDLAKIIESKIPGSVYDPFLLKREGALGFVKDTWAALDAYVKRATRKVNMDEALSRLEESSKSLELSQWNYIKRYADRINLRPTEIENLFDNTIKQIAGYRFGQRPTIAITSTARRMIFRGTLGLNIGSALKNLTQGVNTYAELGEKYTALGYMKLITNWGSDELKPILSQDFIQDRTLSASKKFWQTIDKGLFSLFETAEHINRGAAYFGAKSKALAKGINEADAIKYAQDVVRKTQFMYGSIDTPVALQSSIVKTLSQFQSFSIKQAEFLLGKLKNKDFAGLIRYIGASMLVFGTIGKMFGMKVSDLIPSFRFDTPPTLALPKAIFDAVVGSKDQYGNVPNVKKRVENIFQKAVPLIPGGSQIKRSIQGLGTVSQGKSTTSSGKTQYEVEQSMSNLIKAGLFGKYNLPEAQKYYNKTQSKSTNRFSR